MRSMTKEKTTKSTIFHNFAPLSAVICVPSSSIDSRIFQKEKIALCLWYFGRFRCIQKFFSRKNSFRFLLSVFVFEMIHFTTHQFLPHKSGISKTRLNFLRKNCVSVFLGRSRSFSSGKLIEKSLGIKHLFPKS